MTIAIAIIGGLALACGLVAWLVPDEDIDGIAQLLWLPFTLALFILALVK